MVMTSYCVRKVLCLSPGHALARAWLPSQQSASIARRAMKPSSPPSSFHHRIPNICKRRLRLANITRKSSTPKVLPSDLDKRLLEPSSKTLHLIRSPSHFNNQTTDMFETKAMVAKRTSWAIYTDHETQADKTVQLMLLYPKLANTLRSMRSCQLRSKHKSSDMQW